MPPTIAKPAAKKPTSDNGIQVKDPEAAKPALARDRLELLPTENFLGEDGFQEISSGGAWDGWVDFSNVPPGTWLQGVILCMAEYYAATGPSADGEPRYAILVRYEAGNAQISVPGKAPWDAEAGNVVAINYSEVNATRNLAPYAMGDDEYEIRLVHMGQDKSRRSGNEYHVFKMGARKTGNQRDKTQDRPFSTQAPEG